MMKPVLLLFLLCASRLFAVETFEEPPIRYTATKANNALTRIADRIALGEALFQGPTDQEILTEVLKELDIDRESQVLVFSKTSAQNARISPQTPRAIYFSENAYVGWVQNGDIEVISFDKTLGAVFHIIDLNRRKKGTSPEIRRDSSCLSCHAGPLTHEVPGILVRSVYPDPTGRPLLNWGSSNTTHSSPIASRWGGWYVTGRSGSEGHLGNRVFSEERDELQGQGLLTQGTVEDLSLNLNSKPYPDGGRSDIIALMLLEHQVSVHNAILAGHLSALRFRYLSDAIQTTIDKEKPSNELSESYQRALENLAEKIVKALLFADEYKLPDDGPEGGEAFQEAFTKRALRASNGHSLREFRLYERLFKYRCSYLIYSEPFTYLAPDIKVLVLRRLHTILADPGKQLGYEYLSASECQQIEKILSETLPAWNETKP